MQDENLYPVQNPVQMPVSPAFPVPPLPPMQQSAHHGRGERCAKRAYDAVMRADWPAHVYADDVFEPESESDPDERFS